MKYLKLIPALKYVLLLTCAVCFYCVAGAQIDSIKNWNRNTQLIPWKMPLPINKKNIRLTDLDKDGDADLLYYFINDNVPIVWIDDDDDMKWKDKEGDTDSDCLLIDRNKDSIFAGPEDFSIDWCDEDGNGIADVQVIVNYGKASNRNFFDWAAEIMYVMDTDKDEIMHYIDWNAITMLAWEHNGHSNFYEDYHGNTSFIKMHASSFRIDDLRYSWENPFLFYDTDNDGLTEMAIRFVNAPTFRNKEKENNVFRNIDTAYDAHFNGRMDYVGITWDLDNDNTPANEFDFDMSLLLKGDGFDYTNQRHKFKSLKGLDRQSEFLFYDKRWRQLDELIYPDRDSAWKLTFKNGNWNYCSLVVDEDDDCNRWERVEFYEPKDIFKTGGGNGGLDNNLQADVAGDRGEFDTDFSGKGKLYIGTFDGRLHLYGAEWGAWRIDQTAYSFQGYGGIYDRWRGKGRMQQSMEKFATIKYEDANNNGFIDKIFYDLDGDKLFEDSVSFQQLGLDDKQPLFSSELMTPLKAQQRFKIIANNIWQRAGEALALAKKMGISTYWYNFYKSPKTLQQQYEYGYWLNFYIYRDLLDALKLKNDQPNVLLLQQAYYAGNWQLMMK